MKKIMSAICTLLVCTVVMAQKPILSFEETSHDFGEIQEADGPVNCEFKYTNTGSTPLVLHNVQASCGCTTPQWTRTPVQPGASGTIQVTFNPSGRPGTFNKAITIQSNAENGVTSLRIVGNVLKKPKTLEDEYPIVKEGLRMADDHMAFTKLSPNETKMTEIKVYNASDNDLTPQFLNVPQYVKVVCQPATIKPHEFGVIMGNYDAAKKGDWGFVSDNIYMIFDGVKKYSNRIVITADIREDFSKWSEAQLASAPVIEFDDKNHDFGAISQTAKVEHDFVVTNKGEDNLIIRKVRASCGCTAVNPAKTVLAKGESTTIHVTFDPRSKSGRQNKTITVISNDPKQSNILLHISCTVNPPTESSIMK